MGATEQDDKQRSLDEKQSRGIRLAGWTAVGSLFVAIASLCFSVAAHLEARREATRETLWVTLTPVMEDYTSAIRGGGLGAPKILTRWTLRAVNLSAGGTVTVVSATCSSGRPDGGVIATGCVPTEQLPLSISNDKPLIMAFGIWTHAYFGVEEFLPNGANGLEEIPLSMLAEAAIRHGVDIVGNRLWETPSGEFSRIILEPTKQRVKIELLTARGGRFAAEALPVDPEHYAVVPKGTPF